jgi:predicted DsbA family dithiol-disulfide isomerase
MLCAHNLAIRSFLSRNNLTIRSFTIRSFLSENRRTIIHLKNRLNGMTAATNTTMANKKSVDVTITSDLLCPWCYVGLRKLQEASKIANVETKITWKPFLLRPNMPEEGKLKDGTPASRVGASMKAAGESAGINFTGLTDRAPNTILFHATMKYVLEKANDISKQTEFQEQVFDAYFTKGVYPDQKGLLECAEKAGVYDLVKALYGDTAKLQELRQAVMNEAREASRRGISGVPSFEFDGEPAFSGAQNVKVFVQHLDRYAK